MPADQDIQRNQRSDRREQAGLSILNSAGRQGNLGWLIGATRLPGIS